MINHEIEAWLNGPRDYGQGRALFEKYSKRQPLINLFRRRHKPEVLRYNLEKLIGQLEVKHIPKEEILTTQPQTKRLVVLDNRVRLENLPEHLQHLYRQNRTLYKQMRALHEKMKLSATDQERATLRKEVAQYDDVITLNWQKLDEWDQKAEAEVEAPQLTEEETARQIGAIRKFLSVNLRTVKGMEGLKRQMLLFKIEERALQLRKLGVKITDATHEELKTVGIYLGA